LQKAREPENIATEISKIREEGELDLLEKSAKFGIFIFYNL
jgi:hypothetical protein